MVEAGGSLKRRRLAGGDYTTSPRVKKRNVAGQHCRGCNRQGVFDQSLRIATCNRGLFPIGHIGANLFVDRLVGFPGIALNAIARSLGGGKSGVA
jgi:hypothetical protein